MQRFILVVAPWKKTTSSSTNPFRSWRSRLDSTLVFKHWKKSSIRLIFFAFFAGLDFSGYCCWQPQNSSNRPTTTYGSNPKPQSQAKSSALHMGEVESSNRMLPSKCIRFVFAGFVVGEFSSVELRSWQLDRANGLYRTPKSQAQTTAPNLEPVIWNM